MRFQPMHFQHGLNGGGSGLRVHVRHAVQASLCGFSTSRRWSTTRLMPMMATASAMHGKNEIQYSPDNRYSKPLEISIHSEGSETGTPTPRNDSVASSARAWDRSMVAIAIT